MYAGDAKNYSWDSQTKEVREKYAMILDTLMLIIIACVFFLTDKRGLSCFLWLYSV